MKETIYTYRVADKPDIENSFKWYRRCDSWAGSLDKRIVKAVEDSIKEKGRGTYSYGKFTFDVTETTSAGSVSNKQVCEDYRNYLDKHIKLETQKIGIETVLGNIETLKKKATGDEKQYTSIVEKPEIDENAVLRRISVPVKKLFSDNLEDITIYQNVRTFISSMKNEIIKPYEQLLTKWFEKEVMEGKDKKEFDETLYGQYIVNNGADETDLIDAYLIADPAGEWAKVVAKTVEKLESLKAEKETSVVVLDLKRDYDALVKKHVTDVKPKKRYFRFNV